MKRLSSLFSRSRPAPSESSKEIAKSSLTSSEQVSKNNNDITVEDEDETKCLLYGISLAHLIELPIPPDQTFNAACEYVKKQTSHLTGYRSYARLLKTTPATQHLVREQPTVFVSYAWSGGFGTTMEALKDHFKDKIQETFVWMDFAIVDQHKAASTTIDFNQWARTFRDSLTRIGQAVLVLTPGEKPIAISRSWCCFEWATIVQTNIPFSYCVPSKDEDLLIEKMHNGMGFDDFKAVFAGINVARAQAFKDSDRVQILELMKQEGIVKVNDIVMKSLKEWLVQVADKAQQRSSDNSLGKAFALNSRGTLHEALGELNEAMSHYEKALAIAKTLPNNDRIMGVLLNNIAQLWKEKGIYAKAEPLLKESLALKRKVLGEDHPSIATALNSLALVYQDKGDSNAAEPLFRQALAIWRKAYGNEHPNVAAVLNNLAELLREKGDNAAAEPLFQESLEVHKKVFGEDHPDVAMALNNLGGLLQDKKEFDGAEPLYRESLAIYKKVYGENHPNVAVSLNNLAELLRDKRDYSNAEPLYRESLAIKIKVYGEDHPKVATSLHNLAYLLRESGKRAEAIPLGRQAHAIALKKLGPNHPDTADYEFWLKF